MGIIQEHKQTLDELNPRDFIDVYLTEMRLGNDLLTLEDLSCAMSDMFMAGTETTSTTLKWTVMFLILHQDVQEKCRQEICSVIGKSVRVKMSDLTSLPYTMAVITEIQRMARVAPSSLLHRTTKPTKVGEYFFPAKSLFVANLSYITHNPAVVSDPYSFKPDRWIDPNGR